MLHMWGEESEQVLLQCTTSITPTSYVSLGNKVLIKRPAKSLPNDNSKSCFEHKYKVLTPMLSTRTQVAALCYPTLICTHWGFSLARLGSP